VSERFLKLFPEENGILITHQDKRQQWLTSIHDRSPIQQH